MRKPFSILLPLFFILFQASAQYPNILIGDYNFPEEPSIMINPKNVNEMVAGANIENYYYSSDAGMTWQWGYLQSTYGVWGDPVIGVDTAGDFYFLHLSNPSSPGNWIDRIVCQKSTDGGQTWSSGTYMGLNGSKAQDKHWIAVDRTNNNLYVTWTQFDEYDPTPPNPLDSSMILFSKSLDGGETWSQAKRINRVAGDCYDSDNTVEGAVPAVGPNGEIFVSWAGPVGLVFNRSLDQGETWMSNNVLVNEMPGGWDFAMPGISRANGLPITCCDVSNGPHRGTIYVNWADQRYGPMDTDIWLSKSTDGGMTWSPAKRVNDDPPGKNQFFTWLTIDQTTGFLWFVFYDRRNYSNNYTDVYMAVSRDGGETFVNFKISESPFNPDFSIFFGDYNNISAHDGVVRPIWTRLHNSQLSVHTAIIDSLYLGIPSPGEKVLPFSLEQNYPNPVLDETNIAFKIHQSATLTLKVMDLYGREMATLFKDRHFQPGKYIERFNAQQYKPSPGIYYFSLESDRKSIRQKMVIR